MIRSFLLVTGLLVPVSFGQQRVQTRVASPASPAGRAAAPAVGRVPAVGSVSPLRLGTPSIRSGVFLSAPASEEPAALNILEAAAPSAADAPAPAAAVPAGSAPSAVSRAASTSKAAARRSRSFTLDELGVGGTTLADSLDEYYDGALTRGKSEPAAEQSAPGQDGPDDADGRLGPADKPAPVPSEVPPAPKDAAAPKEEKTSVLSLFKGVPRVLWLFLAAFVATQFGIEALGVAIPQLAGAITSNYGVSAAVATFSTLGLAAGGLSGGWISRRFGHWGGYGATLAARALAIGAMAAFSFAGALTPVGLVALFTLDYVFLGASRTIEAVIPKRVLGSEVLKLNNFATLKNLLTDGIGMLGPVLIGLAYQAFGAASGFYWITFAAYAATFAASAVIPFLAARFAAAGAAASAGAAEEKGDLAESWRAIRGNSTLRWATMAYSVLYAFNIGIYFLVGPVFGYWASGGDLAAAGQITSLLAGLNAAGGIFSYYWTAKRNARVAAATKDLPPSEREAARRADTKRFTAKLTLGGAAALLSFWTYFWAAPLVTITLPVLGFAIPIFIAQLVMLPMGFLQSASLNQLESLIQAELPDRVDEGGMSIVKFQSYAANAAISFGFGALLAALSVGVVPTAAALLALNAGITALAAGIGFIGWKLLRP